MAMASLLDKEVLLLDGGLGTTLEDNYNVKFDEQTPLWSSHLLVTDPDKLEKALHDFVKAGADIILTPTYQASYEGFTKTVIDGERLDFFEEICQYLDLGVDLSRHAFNNKPGLVALSLGAYGATLQPSQEFSGQYGDVDERRLEDWHVQRIAMFWASFDKVDLVAFETIPRLDELRAVRTAANVNRHKSVFKPYWVSCVFPNNDNRLPDGSTIEEIVRVLLEEREWEDGTPSLLPFGLGINCTKVEKYPSLIAEFEAAAEKLNIKLPRLVLYPNGSNGQAYDSNTHTWVGAEDKVSKDDWDDTVFNIVEEVKRRGKWRGIIVGGCCKTGPIEIGKLRTRIDAMR